MRKLQRVYKFFLPLRRPLHDGHRRWSCRTIFAHLWANKLNLKHPTTLQSTYKRFMKYVIVLRHVGSSGWLWRSICVIRSCGHIYGGLHVTIFELPEPPRGSQTSLYDHRYLLIQRAYVLCNVFCVLRNEYVGPQVIKSVPTRAPRRGRQRGQNELVVLLGR